MLTINVRNYRGVASADIFHEKLSLVAGRNHNGKSSVAEAIAAVMTGDPLPIPDMTKGQADRLVRDGAKSGTCQVSDGESAAMISWPDCTASASGPALPNISKTAAGLASVLDLRKKDRADYLAPFLKSEPTAADIAKELKSLDFSQEIIDKLLEKVKISGLHNVYLAAKETGTKLKGQWEGVTGEKFGYARIESWMPGKWYAGLSHLSEEILAGRVAEFKASVEAGIAAEAVAGLEVEQIAAAAAQVPALEKDLKAFRQKVQDAIVKESALSKEHAALSSMPDEIGCPHCGGLLQINGGKIEIYTGLSDAEIDARIGKLKTVGDDLLSARESLENLRKETSTTAGKVDAARQAAGQLEKVKAAGTEKWTKNLAEQRQLLQAAENDLNAFVTRAKAKTLAAGLKGNKIIVDLLSPQGLRETKLKAALAPFNKSLAALAESAGFGDVRIDEEMEVTMNGRPAGLCSKSEQFQIRTLFQLVIAQLESARVVLVDGADIIVGRERNGLIQALLAAQVPAIVFMSMNQAENMPPLEKVGGRCFWIEEGEIKNGQ